VGGLPRPFRSQGLLARHDVPSRVCPGVGDKEIEIGNTMPYSVSVFKWFGTI
jgi:hypothetical protein